MQINSKWKKATIHLECAADSQSSDARLERFVEQSKLLEEGEISALEYAKILRQGSRDIRYHGTAIFFTHKKNRYLITARHVINDGEYMQESLRDYDSQYSYKKNDAIYSIIFRVPSLDEVLLGKGEPFFLMNLGAGVPWVAPYTFSDIEDDLAIISLDQRHTRFADDLIERGYEPIKIEDIAGCPSSEGEEIFTIGFPGATAIMGQSNSEGGFEAWSPSCYSLPVFAFGRVAMLHDSLSFFWADISVYPGNSGGPVIANDQLVGIVSGQATDEIDNVDNVMIRIPFAKVIKSGVIFALLETQIEKDDRNSSWCQS